MKKGSFLAVVALALFFALASVTAAQAGGTFDLPKGAWVRVGFSYSQPYLIDSVIYKGTFVDAKLITWHSIVIRDTKGGQVEIHVKKGEKFKLGTQDVDACIQSIQTVDGVSTVILLLN